MKRACQWIRARLDSDMEPNRNPDGADIMEHLGDCAGCTEILRANRELRRRLRTAIEAEPIPPYLAARVNAHIETGEHKRGFSRNLLVAAAVLVVAGVVSSRGLLRSSESEDAMWQRLSAGESPVMRVGLHDHVHCALFQKYPRHGPSLAILTRGLGREYGDLAKIVQDNLPGALRVIEAHKCRVDGRTYIHVIARDGDRMLSLIATEKKSGETLGQVVSRAAGELSIAAFETPRHLVYLVSSLDEGSNLATMRAMTPAVRDLFQRVEL